MNCYWLFIGLLKCFREWGLWWQCGVNNGVCQLPVRHAVLCWGYHQSFKLQGISHKADVKCSSLAKSHQYHQLTNLEEHAVNCRKSVPGKHDLCSFLHLVYHDCECTEWHVYEKLQHSAYTHHCCPLSVTPTFLAKLASINFSNDHLLYTTSLNWQKICALLHTNLRSSSRYFPRM